MPSHKLQAFLAIINPDLLKPLPGQNHQGIADSHRSDSHFPLLLQETLLVLLEIIPHSHTTLVSNFTFYLIQKYVTSGLVRVKFP